MTFRPTFCQFGQRRDFGIISGRPLCFGEIVSISFVHKAMKSIDWIETWFVEEFCRLIRCQRDWPISAANCCLQFENTKQEKFNHWSDQFWLTAINLVWICYFSPRRIADTFVWFSFSFCFRFRFWLEIDSIQPDRLLNWLPTSFITRNVRVFPVAVAMHAVRRMSLHARKERDTKINRMKWIMLNKS